MIMISTEKRLTTLKFADFVSYGAFIAVTNGIGRFNKIKVFSLLTLG